MTHPDVRRKPGVSTARVSTARGKVGNGKQPPLYGEPRMRHTCRSANGRPLGINRIGFAGSPRETLLTELDTDGVTFGL